MIRTIGIRPGGLDDRCGTMVKRAVRTLLAENPELCPETKIALRCESTERKNTYYIHLADDDGEPAGEPLATIVVDLTEDEQRARRMVRKAAQGVN